MYCQYISSHWKPKTDKKLDFYGILVLKSWLSCFRGTSTYMIWIIKFWPLKVLSLAWKSSQNPNGTERYKTGCGCCLENSLYLNLSNKNLPNAPCFAACEFVKFWFCFHWRPGLDIEMGTRRVRMRAGGRRSAESGRSDPFLHTARKLGVSLIILINVPPLWVGKV